MAFQVELESIEFKIKNTDLVSTVKGFKLNADEPIESVVSILSNFLKQTSSTVKGLHSVEDESAFYHNEDPMEFAAEQVQTEQFPPNLPDSNDISLLELMGQPGFPARWPENLGPQPQQGVGNMLPFTPQPGMNIPQGPYPYNGMPAGSPAGPNQNGIEQKIIYKGRGFDSYEEFQRFMSMDEEH